MDHTLSSGRRQIAAVCCGVSVIVLAWTMLGGTRLPRSQSGTTITVLPPPTSGSERVETTSDDLVESALDHNPFSPTRRRPVLRYGAAAQPVEVRAVPVPEVLRLVGTVVDAGGASFVLCQLGTGAAHMVRVGQTLGTYQLRSISQGSAIFVTGDGQRLELRVPKTGS
jgi:hypothetical protein